MNSIKNWVSDKIWESNTLKVYEDCVEYRENESMPFKLYQYQDLKSPHLLPIVYTPQYMICDWLESIRSSIFAIILGIIILSYSGLYGFLYFIGVGIIINLHRQYKTVYFRLEFKDGVETFEKIYQGNKKDFEEKAFKINKAIRGFENFPHRDIDFFHS